ncbi:phosphoribosylglycinamide formyltransferase [Adhaeribacter rhizoryzae]|uniref:Phosphoribosylglycinamide formyltransferase n=1 Tax=Adhaeribacter rhizoryzae TaxID=2607907 RepID=A0A5M6D2Z1_9BACT|nr:phosphoribosylglycinamide formyltransferase [Adhaeribacter rhizoryzae]KAA5539525.1 phosphoribosylglycinamide formyltransferase [Adhaeribacter rhizoryzae]
MSDTLYKRVVIFASGSGSNAQRLMEHFQNHPQIRVVALFSNNPTAYALQRAENFNLPAHVFNREQFKDGTVLEQVKAYQPDLIVLAGFLWLVPVPFIQAFPQKIINIHPGILPKYGGKGMHGQHVHQAVLDNKETETGITIHYVNEFYDQGATIYQELCPVQENDTAEILANRVLQLEHEHFPRIVEKILIG